MENLLCPMKKIKTVTKGSQDNYYHEIENHIESFGDCDRENCAWWTWGMYTTKDKGYCAIQATGCVINPD